MPGRFIPSLRQKEPQYTFKMGVGGSQNRSGRFEDEENLCPLSRFEAWIVQPVSQLLHRRRHQRCTKRKHAEPKIPVSISLQHLASHIHPINLWAERVTLEVRARGSGRYNCPIEMKTETMYDLWSEHYNSNNNRTQVHWIQIIYTMISYMFRPITWPFSGR
jgi:hypothetical protein